RRAAFWSAEIKEARTRVALIEGVGFAAAGRQRDTAMIKQGFAEELYALYVRSAAYGLGAGLRLFATVLPEAGPGFTATVLDGNARAIRFYERQGGTVIGTLEEQRPGGIIRERIYCWPEGRGGLA
ncbi:MAG: GNAT family N-acetyltransferase, partial [Pseudomonadota bacterium]